MLTEVSLTRLLIATVELDPSLPMNPATAVYVVRALAPKLMRIIRDEIAEDRRARAGKETQL